MRFCRPAALLAFFLSLPGTAFAQLDASRLIGVVRDAQGAVLPGVTVTATSPALIGSQAATTEASGAYRFPALPPGEYVLTFELSGFQSLKRTNIVLALSQTLTIDAELQVATIQETVTVTGDSPVIDLESTTLGNTLGTEQLTTIPTSTDIWAALSMSPGVRMRGFDVGGGNKSEQRSYEAFGIFQQSRIVTDGVDTTEGAGGSGFYQDYYAQEEIAVVAGGADVTMNTAGAAVISTIKSGGNSFKSLLHVSYEHESFVGDNIDDETARRGFTGQPNLKFYETHADLGGPILRDKLWFFGAYNRFVIDKSISGVSPDIATYQGFYRNFTTKETYKASSRDTIIGYYQRGYVVTPFRTLSATVDRDASGDQNSWTHMGNVQHQRVWSNRLFSDVKVGRFGYYFPQQPQKSVDYRERPPRIDLATQVRTGAYWDPFIAKRDKPQLFGTLTYFLPQLAGDHDLKVGGEWLDDRQYTINNGTAGPIWYRDRAGVVDEIRLVDYGDPATADRTWTGAENRNRRVALFAQDRWSITNRITLTVGVRYDRQRPYYLESRREPVLTGTFQSVDIPGRSLLVRHAVAPRIGLSWDAFGDTKSVLKAFYGRYYNNLAQSFGSVNPGGSNSRDYKFNDLNGNRIYDGPEELGLLVATAGGATTTLDKEIRLPYTDELNFSYQRQFWGEASLRAAYVRKMSRDHFATFNTVREGQFTVPIQVTVPLQSFDEGSQGTRTLTVFDIPPSLRGIVQNVTTNIPDSVGGGDYTYDTVQVAFNKRFSRGLFLDASVDYQWRDELKQNSASTSVFVTDPIAVGYFQNVYPDAPNRQENTTWQARLSGRYLFPHDVGVGLNWQTQSGWPYARLVNVALPNAGTQTIFLENIKENRSDTVSQVNVRLDKAFSLASRRLTFMVDIYNAFNVNPVYNFNLVNGPQYNRIIAALDPRTIQLGLRFEF